jgi:hypothetical protein
MAGQGGFQSWQLISGLRSQRSLFRHFSLETFNLGLRQLLRDPGLLQRLLCCADGFELGIALIFIGLGGGNARGESGIVSTLIREAEGGGSGIPRFRERPVVRGQSGNIVGEALLVGEERGMALLCFGQLELCTFLVSVRNSDASADGNQIIGGKTGRNGVRMMDCAAERTGRVFL